MQNFYIQMKKINASLFVVALGSSLLLASCGGEEDKKDGAQKVDQETKKDFELKRNNEAVVDGLKFSIPSPILTMDLVKKSGADFNSELVNDDENAASYNTDFKRALNLGVYGCDLGYLTVNGRMNEAPSYMNVAKTLADQLNVSGAFDESLMNRVANNMDNPNIQDTLKKVVGEAFKAGNEYLQKEQRFDVVGLMLAGGMIESMYVATDVGLKTNDANIINLLANQRPSLSSLISLLSKYKKEDDNVEELVGKLITLENSFNMFEKGYTYAEPRHNPDTKTTTLTSSSSAKISPEDLEQIQGNLIDVRNFIIK